MSNPISHVSLTLGVALGVMLMSLPAAEAATISSKFRTNAAGICQSAFSAGAGAVVRARPLSVQNEGINNAFVTCSFPYDDEAEEQPTSLGVRFISAAAANVTVSCTLVSGSTFNGTVNYVPRDTAVNAGSTTAAVFFDPADLPGAPTTIFAPNVSCALPPGIGIQYVYYYYNRQIGT